MIVIHNARIYPMVGDIIESGTVVINDGKIQDILIGENTAIIDNIIEENQEQDIRIIDANGALLYPGFRCTLSLRYGRRQYGV